MKATLVHQIPPEQGNPRNSEGDFLRGKRGEILFAYSRYHGESIHDHASCDIAMIESFDEGNTWSAPRIIAHASDFGVENIMSVSSMVQNNGDLAFYFLIKEADGGTTVGRAVSRDGLEFQSRRCRAEFPKNYYVVNNDRLLRLKDGRLIAPAAYVTREDLLAGAKVPYTTTLLVSEDDGESFSKVDFDFVTTDRQNARYGLQEPGIMECEDGSLYLWMRTNSYCQYESRSKGDLCGFTTPAPSQFTSPPSPMQIKLFNGVYYAAYNPIPRYNGRVCAPGTADRTPFVLRKSEDGRHFGVLNTIEDDPNRGYCYPALFQTRDDHLLIAYCRGDAEDGNMLCRLGISRIELSSIE